MQTKPKKFHFFRLVKSQRKSTRQMLTALDKEYIADTLARYMEERKPFLRCGYSIRDLAREMQLPPWQISAFLNQEIGSNFNNFLNHYRVWHCEELIQAGQVSDEPVELLALLCGFSNRNSLTIAFKKFTGFTPARYQKGWLRLMHTEDTEP